MTRPTTCCCRSSLVWVVAVAERPDGAVAVDDPGQAFGLAHAANLARTPDRTPGCSHVTNLRGGPGVIPADKQPTPRKGKHHA
jgi:hypothetical protein